MLKTEQRPILTADYGYFLENYSTDWASGSSELEIARNGAYFFMSKLSFNTDGLNIRGEATLLLELTTTKVSNPYGTSLILTTSELTGAQVANLVNESAVNAVDGLVAWTHCTSHVKSGDIAANKKFSYTLTANLKKGTPYYIYLKRRVGLDKWGDINGYTACYNPAHASYADTGKLELSYKPDGTMVFHDGKFRSGTIYTGHNGVWVEGVSQISKGE